jgi:hypothetical protein
MCSILEEPTDTDDGPDPRLWIVRRRDGREEGVGGG